MEPEAFEFSRTLVSPTTTPLGICPPNERGERTKQNKGGQ